MATPITATLDYQCEVNRRLAPLIDRINGSLLTERELEALAIAHRNGASVERFVAWVVERRTRTVTR